MARRKGTGEMGLMILAFLILAAIIKASLGGFA